MLQKVRVWNLINNAFNKMNSTFALHAAAIHFSFELNCKKQGKKVKVCCV